MITGENGLELEAEEVRSDMARDRVPKDELLRNPSMTSAFRMIVCADGSAPTGPYQDTVNIETTSLGR